MPTPKPKRSTYRSINALTKVTDAAVRAALAEVEHDELALSLKDASEAVKEAVFRNMSKRAESRIRDDMAYMGPVRAADVRAARRRIVEILNAVANPDGTLLQKSRPSKPRPRSSRAARVRAKYNGFSCRTAAPTELLRFLVDLARLAKTDGVLAVETVAELVDPHLRLAIQLAVDGTCPDLIGEILTRKENAMEQQARLRHKVIQAGLTSLQRGVSPRLIRIVCAAELPHGIDMPEVNFETPEGMDPEGAARLRLRKALRDVLCADRSPAELATLFTLFADVARRSGLLALRPFGKSLDPLTRLGMGLVLDGIESSVWPAIFDARSRQVLTGEVIRLRMVHIGIMAIQYGTKPEVVRRLCKAVVG